MTPDLYIKACYLDEKSEIIVYSGCTQEFYTNRLDLDDHTESLLTFGFGVKSLYQVAIEYVEKYFDFNAKKIEDICLPKVIKDVLKSRAKDISDKNLISRPSKDVERVFSRNALHIGL